MRFRLAWVILVAACTGTVGGFGGGSASGGGSGTGGGAATGGAGGGAATGGGSAGGGGAATGGGTSAGGGSASGGGAAGTDAGFDGGTDAGLDAGTDAGVDAGCGAQFCDDFERGGLNPWKTSLNGGAAALDTTRAHSGLKSVLITNPGASSYERAYLELTTPFFPVSGNAFYGRLWFYLAAAPTQVTHWTNISGEGSTPYLGQTLDAYVRYGGQYSPKLMANYDSSSNFPSDCWQHSATDIPTGKWSCIEWHFVGDADTMELWLDGTQLTDLTVIDGGQGCVMNGLNGRWVMPQFSTLHLGWEHYQASDPIQMWIDDVALDTSKIGCN